MGRNSALQGSMDAWQYSMPNVSIYLYNKNFFLFSNIPESSSYKDYLINHYFNRQFPEYPYILRYINTRTYYAINTRTYYAINTRACILR